MIRDKIKKIFLIASLLFEDWQITQLLNVPTYNYSKQLFYKQAIY